VDLNISQASLNPRSKDIAKLKERMAETPDNVDSARIAAVLRQAVIDHPLEGRARVRLWLWNLLAHGFLFVVVVPLISGRWDNAFDPGRPFLWYRIAMAVVLAGVNVAYFDVIARRAVRDPDAAVARVASDVVAQTAPGWVLRTIRLGLIMGLGIGVPVGLLIALVPPMSQVERFEVFGMFVGLTLLWTQPAAFAIRWLSLNSAKRFLKRAEVPAP
jgi:hypothetical protein